MPQVNAVFGICIPCLQAVRGHRATANGMTGVAGGRLGSGGRLPSLPNLGAYSL